MEQELQAQGLFDAFRLLDKELIDKIMLIFQTIKVERLENGVVRIVIDLLPKA